MAPRQKASLNTVTPTVPATAGAAVTTTGNGRQHTASIASSSVKGSSSAVRAQQAKYSQLDFNSLNIHVLRKYRQVFKLNVKARSSKDELVMAVNRHFSGHMVDEVDTIARFLYTVHSNKGR
ncbi:hypothetical protein GGI19_000458 [Coemansia pectinata]|uniref:Histone deacetylase complex subunit SAP30 Sin3 binding domain-containing protein n=1 Tax=Coemansia pectinata TaxID=1052879 RepID=A0A9W8LEF1_9FUNG|nr:hypothetical protein GGI19_000458 [Coemansia pectinata]KAJ2873014.1 hypothetical protein GGH93_003564 [Coemansia aciculifera]